MQEMDDAFKDRVFAFVRAVDNSRSKQEIADALIALVECKCSKRFDDDHAYAFLKAVVHAYEPTDGAVGTYAFSSSYAGQIERIVFKAFDAYIMMSSHRDKTVLQDVGHILIASWSTDAARFLNPKMTKNERMQFILQRYDLEGIERWKVDGYVHHLNPPTESNPVRDMYAKLYRDFFGNSEATLDAIFEVELMKVLMRFIELQRASFALHPDGDEADLKKLYTATRERIEKSDVERAKLFRKEFKN